MGYMGYFLPENLIEYFDITKVYELGNVSNKKMELEIHLEEKNELPGGLSRSDYESKGFLSSSKIQDFPIRGRAVYLVLKRRRWRHKVSGKEITKDLNLVSEGSKLTQELSDFLKATGRDPRRYDK